MVDRRPLEKQARDRRRVNSVISWSYDAASRLTTAGSAAGIWSFSYSDNGNLTVVKEPGADPLTMSYDMENRLAVHVQPADDGAPPSVASYTYDGDGLKGRLLINGAATTLVWDRGDYLPWGGEDNWANYGNELAASILGGAQINLHLALFRKRAAPIPVILLIGVCASRFVPSCLKSRAARVPLATRSMEGMVSVVCQV